jgi:hypothetical protein
VRQLAEQSVDEGKAWTTLRFQILRKKGVGRSRDSFAAGERDRLCRLMCASASRFRPILKALGLAPDWA